MGRAEVSVRLGRDGANRSKIRVKTDLEQSSQSLGLRRMSLMI
jgi:hypothetical protein